MANGGIRPGAGRKKGFRFPKTLEKLEAREYVRKLVTSKLQPLIEAQVANAQGIQHFFLRDKVTKQFQRITDPDQIEQALNADDAEEGSTYWIFTKDPSVQAFTDLLNRALDKPMEQIQLSGDADKPIVMRWQDPEKS